MADEEHLTILKQGVKVWNAWRNTNTSIRPDLIGASLDGTNLSLANFGGAEYSLTHYAIADGGERHLGIGNYAAANLYRANLTKANLRGAVFIGAYLGEANLSGADLTTAWLTGANLAGADLTGATLAEAGLFETVFADANLSNCIGLGSCRHIGPSIIDHRTLQRSGPLPLAFLRGVGLPDNLIDYLPSLLNQPIQMYSCFISYSSKDEAFAQRLHADLQNKGVRCWFAPEDIKIGDRIADTIDTAIRLRDKLLLVLSETSMTSAWVAKEVHTALVEEEQHGRPVLFPIRVDDAVMDTTEQWAHDIKRTRHIGNFTRWKEHDAYSKALDRLLRDLRVERV
jgi:hypothetical protein